MALQDYLTYTYETNYSVVIAALIVLILCFMRQKNHDSPQSTFWKAHPMCGAKAEIFWWPRLVVRSFFGSKAMVDEGYKEVSKSQ